MKSNNKEIIRKESFILLYITNYALIFIKLFKSFNMRKSVMTICSIKGHDSLYNIILQSSSLILFFSSLIKSARTKLSIRESIMRLFILLSNLQVLSLSLFFAQVYTVQVFWWLNTHPLTPVQME